jgi:CYTH domain-containing protein
VIEKYRTRINYDGKVWEVDEFEGENKGLIMAEIELVSEDETFSVPPWIGEEVTGDIRYYNSRLAIHPFRSWE